MAEVLHIKLETLIKEQASEGLCASCGEKVHWLLTGPLTSSSSSNFNCCSRWSVLYSGMDVMPNGGWMRLFMAVVFASLRNDTAVVLFFFLKVRQKAFGSWQYLEFRVWAVFSLQLTSPLKLPKELHPLWCFVTSLWEVISSLQSLQN